MGDGRVNGEGVATVTSGVLLFCHQERWREILSVCISFL